MVTAPIDWSKASDAEINRYYDECFQSNPEQFKPFDEVVDSDDLSVVSDGECAPDFERDMRVKWAGFERVGQGNITNGEETGKKACGGYFGLKGCVNMDLHQYITLHGHDCAGKVPWFKQFRYCDKPDCPICFKSGWAVKEARAIERRIKHFEEGGRDAKGKLWNGLGKSEHIVWSPSPKDYGLSFEQLRTKMFRDLKGCHVVGGGELFHMERFAKAWEARKRGIPEGWRIGLHFHHISFIDGGYERCRLCKKPESECLECDGFNGCARRRHFGYVDKKGRKHEGDGAIIEVISGHVVNGRKVGNEGRSTVFGTAWYQLHHATLRVGVKHQHVFRWYGICSRRKRKLVNAERYVAKCPICAYDLEWLWWVGKGSFDGGKWWKTKGESDYRGEDGLPQWVLGKRGGSGA